jgi:microcystin degradation protein MlrC
VVAGATAHLQSFSAACVVVLSRRAACLKQPQLYLLSLEATRSSVTVRKGQHASASGAQVCDLFFYMLKTLICEPMLDCLLRKIGAFLLL